MTNHTLPSSISKPIKNNLNLPVFEESTSRENFSIFLDLIPELGLQGATVYSYLSYRSNIKGWAWESTKNMSSRLGIPKRSLEKALSILQKGNYTFHNVWNSPVGKIRHIVTKDNGMRYWNGWMKKHAVPDNIKKKFVEEFLFENNVKINVMEKKPPLVPKKIEKNKSIKKKPTACGAGAYATACGAGASYITKVIYDIKAKQQNKNDAADFQKKEEEKKLEEELKKSKLNVRIGMKYFEYFYDTFKKNPIGAVIHAVNNDYAVYKVDLYEKQQQERKKSEKKIEDQLERMKFNKKLSKKIIEKYGEKSTNEYTLYMDNDLILTIRSKSQNRCQIIQYSHPDAGKKLICFAKGVGIQI